MQCFFMVRCNNVEFSTFIDGDTLENIINSELEKNSCYFLFLFQQ
jgi:hypothetical protein